MILPLKSPRWPAIDLAIDLLKISTKAPATGPFLFANRTKYHSFKGMRSGKAISAAIRLFVIAVLTSALALACADNSYTPDFESLQSRFMQRGVSAMLLPGNDTRDNLIFLIADRRKQQLPSFAANENSAEEAAFGTYGEGTICVSDENGRTAFAKAVAEDAAVPEVEKQLLLNARKTLSCTDEAASPNIVEATAAVQSANGRELVSYLHAIAGFYKIDHTEAKSFAALSNAKQPWVRETARYMQARVALLLAQSTAFDEYGTLEMNKVDLAQIAAAMDALKAYVAAYPAGAYAKSATGLLRRAYWLANDGAGQAAAYSSLLLNHEVNAETYNDVNEVDLKLADASYLDQAADPILVAVELLRQMRAQIDDQGKLLPAMKAEVLEAQRMRFTGHEELFDYLLALHASLIDKDATAVLRLLLERQPDANMSYLELSRQLLRASALSAIGDNSAREKIVALFPYGKQRYHHATLELELAKHDERQKNISAVFENNSLIQDPDIRLRVLDQIAGPILLKQQATDIEASRRERNTALYRLLVRDITQGRFKAFPDDMALLPPIEDGAINADSGDAFAMFRVQTTDADYACPAISNVASLLAKNPRDVTARLCLGEFHKNNSYELQLTPVGKNELGGTGTLFAGKVLARQDIYRDIMKDGRASRNDRAYALFRAIRCYQSVGNNDCGGDAVDKSVRKKWFQELKSRYGDTDWAKQQEVYW